MTWSRRQWPAYLAFAVAMAGNIMLAQNARDAKELRPPVFTREQAVRGRALYGSHCARCHGADLRGREHAPSLLTLRQWSVGFDSLGRFFGYVYANMPPDTPGQHLSLQTHVDIVAYILERNRYPAGDIELPADVEAIDEMSFSRQGQ